MIRRKFCLFMAWLGVERKQTTCKTGRRKSSVRSYTAFARQQIRMARQREAFCTARNYLTALNSFTVFCRTEEITFPMVTAQRMEDYQAWLRHQGICLNTISCYMGSLSAVYNKGKRQCDSRRGDPFAKVFTGNAVTQKRTLDKATIDRLRTASPERGSRQRTAQQLFLFSLYAMGMAFADMAYLRMDDIEGGCIIYRRKKTGQTIRIKIEPCMQTVIDELHQEGSTMVFPLLDSDRPHAIHRQYQAALKQHNRQLKAVAREAGITENITSYMARHTWATLAHERNIPIAVISKAMGHTSERTTRIYIAELNSEIVHTANKEITDWIMDAPLAKRRTL